MKNKLEIQVGDGSLDLMPNAEQDFFATKQLHRLQDLETRNSDETQTLEIPRTPNNVRLLNYNLPTFKSVFAPRQSIVECNVLLGGLPIVSDSILFILGETAKMITIEIFGSQTLFFHLISEDPISQLAFPNETVEWTLAGLAARGVTTAGFLYGNSVWFDNNSGEKYLEEKTGENEMYVGQREVEATGGWFYFHSVLEKILENLELQGLRFDTTVLDENELFQQMVFQLPITQVHDNYEALIPFYSFVTHSTGQGYPPSSRGRLWFDTIISEDPAGIYDINDQEWILQPGLIDIKFHMVAAYFADVYSGGSLSYLSFQLDGVEIFRKTFDFSFESYYIDEVIEFTHDVETVDAVLVVELIRGETTEQYKIFIYQESQFNVVRVGSGTGTTVFPSDWFPNISQKDFVKEILKFFHLVPKEHNRMITFARWDDIPLAIEQDITQYVDRSKGIEKTDYISTYGQENVFSYTANNDVSRKDTDHSIFMNKRLLPEKNDIIKSKFVASDISTIDNFGRVCSPLFSFEYEHIDNNKIAIASGSNTFTTTERHNLEPGDHIFVWDDQALETMKRKVVAITDDFTGIVDLDWNTNHDEFDWDKIVYSKKGIEWQIGIALFTSDSFGNGDIWDGGLFQSQQAFRNIAWTDDLNWEGLVAIFYNNFTASIYNPLVVHVWLTMPIAYFIGLDFLRPAYLEGREAGKFYINALEQFKINGQTRAELIRLETAVGEFTAAFFDVEPVVDVNLGDWETGDPGLTQDYTITNTGVNTIRVTGRMSGDGSQYYSISDPVSIEPGLNALITVTFNGAPMAGTQAAQAIFSSPGAISQVRNLTTNVVASAFTVEPTGAVFLGNWFEGETLSQVYITENTGNAAITIAWSLDTVDPTAWELVGTNPLTLQPGETGNQQINYIGNATDVGTIEATLDYEDIAGKAPPIERGISLNVYPQQFTVIPVADVDLGDWNAGDPPLDQIYSVFNSGSRATIITCVYFGTGWSLVGTNPIPLAANTGSTIIFRFSGQPVADMYLGYVDFINENSLTFRRNARVNIPLVRSYTWEPVGDVQLNWDGVSARPTQNYRWTNTGNGRYSLITANFTNVNFDWLGEGSQVVFDLEVGSFVEYEAQYIGAGTLGNYLATIRTYIDGGLAANRNISCQVNIARLRVEPVAFQRVLFNAQTGANGQVLSSEIHNDGNIPGIFSVEITGGYLTDWAYLGISPVTVQPGESYTAQFRYTAVPENTEYGSIIDIEFTAINTVITSQIEVRSLQMQIPKLKLTPLNIPNLGEIPAGGSVIHEIGNPTAAQITGTGYLEDDYGGAYTLVTTSYVLSPGQQVNRHVRYEGGNSGQKLITVIYPDNASSEEAKISFYVIGIG